ncbi:hypothetical protein [Streptomyces sp. NPDC048411]|uniref:hypothetical protein n=1 Tax=Streptomyces sp. NPDC048411 TaxID=3157206 RepID=UPI0034564B27
MKGNVVVDGKVKDCAVELHDGTFGQKADLIDFEGEFAKLRARPSALADKPVTVGATAELDGVRRDAVPERGDRWWGAIWP